MTDAISIDDAAALLSTVSGQTAKECGDSLRTSLTTMFEASGFRQRMVMSHSFIEGVTIDCRELIGKVEPNLSKRSTIKDVFTIGR